jgi:hypothetical protein
MAPVVPFRRRTTKKRGRKTGSPSAAMSGKPSGEPSSAKSAWLRLANKLQVLALEEADVVHALESIVDGAIEELQKKR